MRLLFFFLTLSITHTAYAQYCTVDGRFTEQNYFTEAEVDFRVNIPYAVATTWDGNEDTLYYDVFYPAASVEDLARRPAILVIHGGGFSGGDKSSWYEECRAFAQRGFVAFTMSYRLGWDMASDTNRLNAIYRAQQDANAALRHIVHHADDYAIDPDWLFVGGSSAGAITALNTTYISQAEWSSIVPDVEMRFGNLTTSGNNLTNDYTIQGIFNNWGATFTGTIQAEDMLPTIAFHGGMDNTVPVDSASNGLFGSRVIHEELVDNGVCSDLTVEPAAGHGIYRDDEGVHFRVGKASCFFKGIFCASCESRYATVPVPPTCSTIVATDDIEREHYLTVYPNPFTTHFNIEGLPEKATIQIFNSIGNLIYHGTPRQNHNWSNLPTGVYYLLVKGTNWREAVRLCKL